MLEKVYVWFVKPHFGKLKIDGRVIASFCLLMFFILMGLLYQNTTHWARIGAMGACFIGDIILMNAWGFPKRLFKKGSYIVGGVCFIIGHVIYVISFYIAAPENVRNSAVWFIIIMYMMGCFVVVMERIISKISDNRMLLRFSFIFSVYFGFLFINGAFAILSTTRTLKGYLAVIAICCFILSDTIVKLEQTEKLDSNNWRFIKWATYIVAQVGLCLV